MYSVLRGDRGHCKLCLTLFCPVVQGTMNVIDCMAIAPYYLTLFFMPQPEMGPIDPAIPTGTVYI